MDPPMSEWFQPVHIGLDSVAQAAKFQFEKMALQLRHFRARCQQQRAFIERLKYEVEELKK
ncbi:hypothetical protein H0H92_000033 [Tricholoma furcatifolium]|nr:hypothetical protein H0H92_000033 [Tricholoma furcatifolium]